MNAASLIKSGMVYWLGRLASRSVSFLLLPVYTAFILPADWGILNILFVTADFLGIITALELPAAMFRFWGESASENERRRLAGTAVTASLILSSILFLPAYLWAESFASMLGMPAHADFIRIVLFTQQLVIIVEIMQAEMRLRDMAVRYAVLEIVLNFLIAGFSIICVAAFRMNAKGILIGQLAAFVVIFSIMAPPFFRRIRWRWDSHQIRTLISFAFPLIPSAISMAAIHSVDRYFIQHFLGATDVGIYSIAHRFSTMILVVFLSPFLLLWDPKSYELARHPDASIRFGRIATYVVAILLFLALGLMTASDELVKIFTAAPYHDASAIIPPLALAYAVYALDPLLRFGLLQGRRTTMIFGIVAFSCIITLAGNMLLIPVFGLTGAAYSTLAAFICLVVLDYTFARQYFRYQFEWRKLRVIGSIFALLFISTGFIHLENPWIGLAVKCCLYLLYPSVLLSTIFRTELTAAFNMIRQKLQSTQK